MSACAARSLKLSRRATCRFRTTCSRVRSALALHRRCLSPPLLCALFTEECVVAMDKLDLDYCGNVRSLLASALLPLLASSRVTVLQTFVKDKKGNYKVHCENKEKKLAFTLTLTPEKKPIRHGHDGGA